MKNTLTKLCNGLGSVEELEPEGVNPPKYKHSTYVNTYLS